MSEVVIIHAVATEDVVQGMPQYRGISARTAGSTGLSMNLTAFPPGGCSRAHYHKGHDTAIYGMTGRIALFHGAALEHCDVIAPGVFCFIPPGVPHVAFNLSDSEPATALSARDDPQEQENVVLTPDLDGVADARAAALKAQELD